MFPSLFTTSTSVYFCLLFVYFCLLFVYFCRSDCCISEPSCARGQTRLPIDAFSARYAALVCPRPSCATFRLDVPGDGVQRARPQTRRKTIDKTSACSCASSQTSVPIDTFSVCYGAAVYSRVFSQHLNFTPLGPTPDHPKVRCPTVGARVFAGGRCGRRSGRRASRGAGTGTATKGAQECRDTWGFGAESGRRN